MPEHMVPWREKLVFNFSIFVCWSPSRSNFWLCLPETQLQYQWYFQYHCLSNFWWFSLIMIIIMTMILLPLAMFEHVYVPVGISCIPFTFELSSLIWGCVWLLHQPVIPHYLLLPVTVTADYLLVPLWLTLLVLPVPLLSLYLSLWQQDSSASMNNSSSPSNKPEGI